VWPRSDRAGFQLRHGAYNDEAFIASSPILRSTSGDRVVLIWDGLHRIDIGTRSASASSITVASD
jgi:hypothetical protein